MLEAGGAQPRWLWQGQKASPELHAWLHQLGAGGGTPIIEALQLATPWLLRRQRHKPGEQQRLLLLTDGRLRDWPQLAALPCPGLLLDTERAPIRFGRAPAGLEFMRRLPPHRRTGARLPRAHLEQTMKELLLVGIGAGDPDYITQQAIKALRRSNVIFLMDKGPAKHKLNALRREICERFPAAALHVSRKECSQSASATPPTTGPAWTS